MSRHTSSPGSVAVIALWVVAWFALSVSYLVFSVDDTFDLRADRLTALAVLDGHDPYVPVSELADRYGSELSWTHIHPRTPGSLVLQTPLAAVPESMLALLSAAGTAAALLAATRIGFRVLGGSESSALLVAVAVAATSIAVESATVGAQSPLIALLLALAWARLRLGDDRWAGVAVGLVVTLKLFPWLVLVMLAFKRPRTAMLAASTAVVLNGAGLLLPGVSAARAVEAVASANLSIAAELNGSVARWFGVGAPTELVTFGLAALGVVAVVAVVRTRWDFDRQWMAVIAIAVAASPLVWRHYALVLVVCLGWLLTRGGMPGRIVTAVAALVFFLPMPLVTVWLIVPLCVAVVLAVAIAPRSEESIATAT